MNEFFKKFFRNPKKDKNDNSPGNAKLLSLIYDYIKDKNAPDNTKLLKLINDYTKDYKYENYTKIIAELKEGDADLLFACIQSNQHTYFRVDACAGRILHKIGNLFC